MLNHPEIQDDDDDALEDFDDDREYIDACIHANQLEDASAINELGDDDDWDEEDLHGSRPIDDPASAVEDEDEDEGEGENNDVGV